MTYQHNGDTFSTINITPLQVTVHNNYDSNNVCFTALYQSVNCQLWNIYDYLIQVLLVKEKKTGKVLDDRRRPRGHLRDKNLRPWPQKGLALPLNTPGLDIISNFLPY